MEREDEQKLKRGFPFHGLSKYTVYLQTLTLRDITSIINILPSTFDPRQKCTLCSSKQ